MAQEKVLIVGGGLQAVSAARSLHDAGYVVGLRAPLSDYAHKSSVLSFRSGGSLSEGIAPIINHIRQEGVAAVLPMSDGYAELLSRNKERIYRETGCRACVPDYDQFEPAVDKLKLMALCRRNGLPHPRTLGEDELTAENISELSFPVLVKPNRSVGARGIVKVSEASALQETVAKVRQAFGECHIQEYIGGDRPYFNVMVYRDARGRCVNSAVLEIIRFYPLQGGSSSMCRTIDSPELVSLCMKTLDTIGYIGFADFDVLQNEKGEYRIIEINPRVPASLRGAYISGVNFPAIIVADALGRDLPVYAYNAGKTLRYLGLDLMWFVSSPLRFRAKPSWFRFFGRDVYYQEGGIADLRAMIGSLISNFNKLEFKGGRLRKKSH